MPAIKTKASSTDTNGAATASVSNNRLAGRGLGNFLKAEYAAKAAPAKSEIDRTTEPIMAASASMPSCGGGLECDPTNQRVV